MENYELSRLVGRISSIQRTYLKLALKERPGIEPEWYYFLHTIGSRKETRKTDTISVSLLLEPTTGIDILNRMIQAGLLNEIVDPQDKRARLISITKKGRTVLATAEQQARDVSLLLFGHLDQQEQNWITSTLSSIENRHSRLLIDNKPKTMDQIKKIIAEEPDQPL